jgi:HTH-type transcriptional regulator, transcriptional repressor of NAD biosynthesis genes
MLSGSKKTGFVLGKFLPPHAGHQYLIDFARNYVDELIIILGTRKTDPIDAKLRIKWLKEMFPGTKLIRVIDKNPEESHPQYWKVWEKTLRKALPFVPNYLFASEDYGFKLAEILGCKYVPVNHARNLVPISGTKIRENAMKYWNFIPPVVRPFFLKKICIYGPESTGKTILTRNLAKHFKTVYCEEYARPLLEFKNGDVKFDDIEKIARGHRASEKALERLANKVLFVDTDLIATSIWSRILFDKCPRWIDKEANNNCYDLYFVTDIDVPFVKDDVRYLPNKRTWFLNLSISELEKRKRKYVIISGSWEERMKKAIGEVEKILG